MPTTQREIQLSSGREIFLKELRQYCFYEGVLEGVLEGVPTTETNRTGIERFLVKG